jgi:hypothetical protein
MGIDTPQCPCVHFSNKAGRVEKKVWGQQKCKNGPLYSGVLFLCFILGLMGFILGFILALHSYV